MLGSVLRSSVFFIFYGAIIHGTIILCQGEGSLFKVQPSNTTVKYGEFVQFECQVHMDYRGSLFIYFGNILLYPSESVQGIFSTLDAEREFSVGINQCTNCLQNETVIGYFWILINTKTLQSVSMKAFRCRVHYNRTFEDSNQAFVEVIYPECTSSSFQSKALIVTSTFKPLINSSIFSVPSSQLPTNSMSVSLQVLNYPCSTGELNTPGNIKTNKVAISICAALILVMLILLILTYVCICVQHRKQLSCVGSSKLSRNQFRNSMVQNPIYESDGPFYDSVQPQFNSQDTAATNTCIDLKHQDLEISTSLLTDKNRYIIDPPSVTYSGSGSFSFSSRSNDHAFEDSTNNGVIPSNKEQAQWDTVMNSTGRISCSSLSGGWDEEESRNDLK